MSLSASFLTRQPSEMNFQYLTPCSFHLGSSCSIWFTTPWTKLLWIFSQFSVQFPKKNLLSPNPRDITYGLVSQSTTESSHEEVNFIQQPLECQVCQLHVTVTILPNYTNVLVSRRLRPEQLLPSVTSQQERRFFNLFKSKTRTMLSSVPNCSAKAALC